MAKDKKYANVVENLSYQLQEGWKVALPEGVVNYSSNKPAPIAVGWGPEAKKGKKNNQEE